MRMFVVFSLIVMSLPAGVFGEDFIDTGLVAARRIEVKDERFPNRGLDKGYLLIEAAALAGDRPAAVTDGWLREARELIEVYKGPGQPLVPIVLPLYEQAVRRQPLKLRQLQQLLKDEREGPFWLNYLLNTTGPIAPDLTLKLLQQLPDDPNREQTIGQHVAQLVMANPAAAWQMAERWPEPTEKTLQLRRGIWLGHTIRIAHDRGLTKFPPAVTERTAAFAQLYFDEAAKQGLGKGPDFQLGMATQIAVQWFLIDPVQGRAALEQVKAAYRPASPPKTGPWAERWRASVTALDERLRQAAILEWLGDSSAKTEWQGGLDQALSLRTLYKQQPAPDPNSIFGRYEYTPLHAVRELLNHHRGLAETSLVKLEPVLTKEDAAPGDELWLDWSSVDAFARPEQAARHAKKIVDPAKQGRAWLRLARAQQLRTAK